MNDDRAFTARLCQSRRQLLALARRVADRTQDGEDILQTALAAAYRVRASYDGARSFAAWIGGFVILCARNHNRKRRPLPRVVRDTVALTDQLAAEWSYEHLLENPEAALQRVGDDLYRAVGALRRDDREVFLLRALLDLTYKDIAAVCATPVGTVMSRLHRARASLRHSLARSEALS